jgi:ribosomal protein S21
MFNELRKREFFETRSERKRKEKAASTRRCIRKIEKEKMLEV